MQKTYRKSIISYNMLPLNKESLEYPLQHSGDFDPALEPPKFLVDMSAIRYRENDYDLSLPPGFVSERRADALVSDLSWWLFSNFSLQTHGFFSETDPTFTNHHHAIPILVDIAHPIDPGEEHMHYIIASTKPKSLEISYGYSEYYIAAMDIVSRRKSEGHDTFIRSVGGLGTTDYVNWVSRNLFDPDLVYGLVVAAHEPIHPLFTEIHGVNRIFDESLVTYLGFQLLTLFINEHPDIPMFIRRAVADFSRLQRERDEFYRLAYMKLTGLYNQQSPDTSIEPNKKSGVLDEIRDVAAAMYRDQEHQDRIRNLVNNAFIGSRWPYTGTHIIKGLFDTHEIDVREFLLSKIYRDRQITWLAEDFSTKFNHIPANLNQQWIVLCRKIRNGQFAHTPKSAIKHI